MIKYFLYPLIFVFGFCVIPSCMLMADNPEITAIMVDGHAIIMPDDMVHEFEEFIQETNNRELAPHTDKLLGIWYGTPLNHEEGEVGRCSIDPSTGYSFIVISPSARGDYVYRKALIWHELFHCLLYLPHGKSGIMRDYLSPEVLIPGAWDKLVDDEFRRVGKEFMQGI